VGGPHPAADAPPAIDPRSMSDEALRAACRPLRGELLVDRFGCLLSLIAGALVLAGFVGWAVAFDVLVLERLVCVAAAVFVVASFGVLAVLARFARARRAPFRTELRRRLGVSPPASYVEEERRLAAGLMAADATLWLHMSLLPHGGHRWVRVRIFLAPSPRAHGELREVRFPAGRGELESAELVRGEADLSDALLNEILALLDDPGAMGLSALETRVIDGAPSTITVIRRHATEVHTGSCNLGGVPDELRGHPTVRFAEALARVAESVRSAGFR
jgi:hypothetical protein